MGTCEVGLLSCKFAVGEEEVEARVRPMERGGVVQEKGRESGWPGDAVGI